MSRCVFISHWVKNISENLSNEPYKVYIAQKFITLQINIVDIAKSVNGILRKVFFRKKSGTIWNVPVVCNIKKKWDNLYMMIIMYFQIIYLFIFTHMTIFKKIDFQPPNGRLDTLVSACTIIFPFLFYHIEFQ